MKSAGALGIIKHALSSIRSVTTTPVIAMDLGTANVRIRMNGSWGVVEEPSIISVDSHSGVVRAGREAMKKSPQSAEFIEPLHGGVITDVDFASTLVSKMFQRLLRFRPKKPPVLACIPSDATPSEKSALESAVISAGASSVTIIPEPIAAAVGAGVDVSSDYAHMIIDVGDGVTDIAVIRNGEVVASGAVRTACGDFLRAISSVVLRDEGLIISRSEAIRLLASASLRAEASKRFIHCSGVDSVLRLHRESVIQKVVLSEAIEPVLKVILKSTQSFFKHLPDKMASEVIESGVCLTGGGAIVPGLAERISREILLDIRIAADPFKSVIHGASVISQRLR